MNTDRTRAERMIQYHSPSLRVDGAAALRRRIVAFVRGVHGDRKNPVTETAILRWFRSTDPEFVRGRLSEAVTAGEVRIVQRSLSSGRRPNGAYAYEAGTTGGDDAVF